LRAETRAYITDILTEVVPSFIIFHTV